MGKGRASPLGEGPSGQCHIKEALLSKAAQSGLWLECIGTVQDMILEQLIEQALFAAYRVGAYALLHLMDDPALLAIVFC